MITLDHVTKSYKEGTYALNDVNIEIEDGEFVFIVGSSGSGKSTFIKLLLRELQPTSGKIIVAGRDLSRLKSGQAAKFRREIGCVFQDFRLLPDRNVYDNVAFAQHVIGVSKKEIRKNVPPLLTMVGLSEKYRSLPGELSGGEQQRVALARALVIEPGVLLFDEPLSNLDAKLRVSMRTEIRRIQQEAGITAVYVTHDQSEAMAISDKVIIMNKGIVEQVATPQEAYYYPNSKFVADFIGECNFLKAKVTGQDMVEIDGAAVKCATGNLETGSECDVVLRPEGATLSDAGAIKGIVDYSCFMGAYQDYRIKVGESFVKIQEYNPKNKKIYKVGDTVFLTFEDNTLYAL